ncbi:MAG: carbohydrate ABC transporter permease [Oscillospiraceae bacterium]|jgi:raffinose/stachyose/melibiose transport system permease protein|nr:carbohydrate ABC transporter permease [Oscillospiraceae bacterium]
MNAGKQRLRPFGSVLKNRALRRSLVTACMIVVAVVMLFPLYVILLNSFKTMREFWESPIAWPKTTSFSNYKYVFGRLDYFVGLRNSAIILAGSLSLMVITGAMAGFVVARRPSKIKRGIYLMFVLGITLPTFTMIFPQIRLITNLGLRDQYLGAVLLYVAMGMPTAMFLYNGFFGTVPREMEEAARIDGCSLWRMFFKIFFPLSVPTTSTLVLVQSIGIWNDVTLAQLVFNDDSKRPLMPALSDFYGKMIGSAMRWDYIYAFIVLCIIPVSIIFVIVNRYLIRGIVEGALKG